MRRLTRIKRGPRAVAFIRRGAAVRTPSLLCGRTFASKAEARRGEELALLERVGQIIQLEYQPKIVLCRRPRLIYTADFAYWLPDGTPVVEDVKGALTREQFAKLVWLLTLDVRITLVESRRGGVGGWRIRFVDDPPHGPTPLDASLRPRSTAP